MSMFLLTVSTFAEEYVLSILTDRFKYVSTFFQFLGLEIFELDLRSDVSYSFLVDGHT